MKHPVLKVLAKVAWAITALVSINVGLIPYGYNFFASNFFMMNPNLLGPINLVILLSGLYSGALLLMVWTGMCCNGKSKCKC